MTNLSENLKLWNSVQETNPAHTKKVKLGRAITAIDPYRQIKNATEQFGPAGQGWGWEVKRVDIFETKEVSVLVRVWVGDLDHYIEQFGQSGLYIDKACEKKDNDHMKKAVTDAVTKCLSCMGFNSDVFLGKFDDNKYVQQMNQKHGNDPSTGQGENTQGNNSQNGDNDDKDWYSDKQFDNDKMNMVENIQKGNATPDQIIGKLAKTYKINKKHRAAIKALK